MSVKKLGALPDLKVQVGVLNERVTTLERALPELRADVKTVLSLVTDLKVALAAGPTRRDLEGLAGEVDALKQVREQAKGGWKVVAALSSLLGAVVGAVMSAILKGAG